MKTWYSRTDTEQEQLACARCAKGITIDFPALDPDFTWSRCRFCGVECMFYSPPGFFFQIVLEDAPPVVQHILRFVKQELDMFGLIELVLCICKIADPSRTRWGYESGEFRAYQAYLRGKNKAIRENYNLGDPDDPKLIIPYPRPRDFPFLPENEKQTKQNPRWFSRTDTRQEKLTCVRCHSQIDVYPPFTNHQTGRCPQCGVECLFHSAPDFHLQIVLEDAPLVLSSVLRYLQSNLDVLDFMHLVLCICQIAEPNRKKWGYDSGEFAAYVAYLRGKDKATRDTYNLGDPDDPRLVIPNPRPRDFVWPPPPAR